MSNISRYAGFQCSVDSTSGEVTTDLSIGVESSRTVADLEGLGLLHHALPLSVPLLTTTTMLVYRFLDDDRVLTSQGLSKQADEGVKYDITVLLPPAVNPWPCDLPKTTGHYHTPVLGHVSASPDFYQVLHGQGAILLQREVGARIESRVVYVKAGDTVLVPPSFAHITINTGPEAMVFANVCVRRAHLNYQDVYRFGGGAYLFFEHDSISVNPRYAELGYVVDPLLVSRPNDDALGQYGIIQGEPIFNYIDNRRITEMLTAPDRHLKLFDDALTTERIVS